MKFLEGVLQHTYLIVWLLVCSAVVVSVQGEAVAMQGLRTHHTTTTGQEAVACPWSDLVVLVAMVLSIVQ